MDNNISGLWFCGLAGSGKTHASKVLYNFIKLAFLVDGDNVRRYVSQDLVYDLPSRKIQIGRIFGISMLAIENGYFPIASSVYMSDEMLIQCQAVGIKVVQIKRPESEIRSLRNIYETTNDVVGKDIQMPELDLVVIDNSGNETFHDDIINLLENRCC